MDSDSDGRHNVQQVSTSSENTCNLWNTLSNDLTNLKNNIQFLINVNIPQSSNLSHGRDEKIDILNSELVSLMENIHFTLDPFWENIKNEMFDLKCLVRKHGQEAFKLKAICKNQEKTIRNLEKKIENMNETMCQQSSCTATLGSTLSSLLWKASKDAQIVQTLISSCRLAEFFDVVSDSLKSFFTTYATKMPHPTSDEVQFIVSLIGIVTNVAAVQEGREFISETPEGQEMVHYFVQYISQISDSRVQRHMLMAIFNVSIYKRGTTLFVNDRGLLRLLKNNLKESNNALKFVSLKLLRCFTYNIDDYTQLSIVFEEIPLTELEAIEEISSNEERTIISGVRQRFSELHDVSITSNSVKI